MKIGIIGRGFVGKAILNYLSDTSCRIGCPDTRRWKGYPEDDVDSYDLKDGIHMEEGIQRIVEHSDIIYLCVPTPMGDNGECDLSYIKTALTHINHSCLIANKSPIVLIKSTMVPGSTEKLQLDYPRPILVTNPEFLRERRANEDMIEANYHVVGVHGGEKNVIAKVLEGFYQERWPRSKTIVMEREEAELLKYLTNSYLAVKVSFANHIYQLARKRGIDYSKFIKQAVESDPRLGTSHWAVPGPDGKLGFGGSCFPKDLSGMIKLCTDLEVDCPVMKAAMDYNDMIRRVYELAGAPLFTDHFTHNDLPEPMGDE